MNERIQQLAEQAGFFPTELTQVGPSVEKFAELIVGECANLFEIEYGTSEVSGNEVARVLKKHFGEQE